MNKYVARANFAIVGQKKNFNQPWLRNRGLIQPHPAHPLHVPPRFHAANILSNLVIITIFVCLSVALAYRMTTSSLHQPTTFDRTSWSRLGLD
jgi:hypothetical protein